MSEPSWTELDAAWTARMSRVREAVEKWRDLIMEPSEPAPGSSLAADDAAFPPLPCSSLAWWGITVGVEHLDAALRLVDQQIDSGGPLLPSANYTVLRAGMLGAAQACVLLLPTFRSERTTFGLRIAHEEYNQVLGFRRSLFEHDALPTSVAISESDLASTERMEKRREEIRALLTERGVSSKRRKLTDTAMIKRAGALVYQRDSNASMLSLGVGMEWQLGSGAAHGRLLMGLHRTGSHVVDDDGRSALIGASAQDISIQIANVTLMVNTAWKAWDARRVKH